MPHMIFCMAVISLGSPEYGNIKELFFSFPFSEIRKKKILNQVEKLSFFYGIIELFLLTLFSSFFPQLFFLPLFPNKLKCFSNRVKKLHFCYPFSLFFLLSFLAPFTIFFFPFSSFFSVPLEKLPRLLENYIYPWSTHSEQVGLSYSCGTILLKPNKPLSVKRFNKRRLSLFRHKTWFVVKIRAFI